MGPLSRAVKQGIGSRWEAMLESFWCSLYSDTGARVPATCADVLSSCTRASRWDLAVSAFNEMRSRGFQGTRSGYAANAYALQRGSLWEFAVSVLLDMTTVKVPPDVVNYNTILGACAMRGDWLLSSRILQTMRNSRVTPDVISYNSTLSACERATVTEAAMQWMFYMPTASIEADVNTFTTLMGACAKSVEWSAALKMFMAMSERRLQQDAICYTVAMGACVRASKWEAALLLFCCMRQHRIARNAVAYGNAICAFREASHWVQALEVMADLERNSVEPDTVIFNNALGACSRNSRWLEALCLVRRMSHLRLQKSATTCNTLVRSLELARQYGPAMTALVEHFPVVVSEADTATTSSKISLFRSARPEAVTANMREAIADRLDRALSHHTNAGEPHRFMQIRPTVAVAATPVNILAPAPVPKATDAELENMMSVVLQDLSPRFEEVAPLLAQIRSALPPDWAAAQVLVYGSGIGGFALNQADVDVTVIPPRQTGRLQSMQGDLGCVRGDGPRHFQQMALIQLRSALSKRGWTVDPVGLGGRVPVLRMHHEKEEEKRVDITIGNMLGVHKSNLLRDYANLDLRLCELVRAVKHWAKLRLIFGQPHGYLGGYAYTLLAIFFCQCADPPLVSSLQALAPRPLRWIDDAGSAFDVSWVDICNLDRRCEKEQWTSTALLQGFFIFYGQRFSFSQEAVSVRLGRRAVREATLNSMVMLKHSSRRVSVEDPIETDWDLGQILSRWRAARVQAEFRRAARLTSGNGAAKPVQRLAALLSERGTKSCTRFSSCRLTGHENSGVHVFLDRPID